ncbi:MAG: dihydrodipicolinate synthase family protein [Spirochaetia bacterium]|nr:dihydrodipicolinate synthase family protein [Spirochaetia bacterium]
MMLEQTLPQKKHRSKIGSGIIPPLVTPLIDPETLDVPGLRRLIEHVLSAGVHGIFILGTTGEGPSHSRKTAKEMIEHTCGLVNQRVPVYVGVSHTSTSATLELADWAEDSGAAAVVLAPPYYLPPSDEEFLAYLAHISKLMPLPIFLYNMPSLTKVHLGIPTILRASGLPNVVGIKDSSGDMSYFHQLLRAFDGSDFSVLMGHEHLIGEALLFGASGGVPGGANVAPSWFVQLDLAARSGDPTALTAAQKKILSLSELYQTGPYQSSGIKGIKCALSLLGLCCETPALPFQSFTGAEQEKIKTILHSLQVPGFLAVV